MPVPESDPRLEEVANTAWEKEPAPWTAHPVFTEYRFVPMGDLKTLIQWMGSGSSLCGRCFTYNAVFAKGTYKEACNATNCTGGAFMPEVDATAFRLEVGQ